MIKQVEREVLSIFDDFFGHLAGVPQDPAQRLKFDPNDLDDDPTPFYETLNARFGVPYDDAAHNFGGFGGTLSETSAFIASRWDGELREEPPASQTTVEGEWVTVPMPWLGEDAVSAMQRDPTGTNVSRMRDGHAAVEAEDYELAYTCFVEAGESLEALQHPEGLDWAGSVVKLARWLAEHDRTEEFSRCAGIILRMRTSRLPPDDPQVAEAWRLHAASWIAQGLTRRARPELERALAIEEAKLGSDHPSTQKTRALLASIS